MSFLGRALYRAAFGFDWSLTHSRCIVLVLCWYCLVLSSYGFSIALIFCLVWVGIVWGIVLLWFWFDFGMLLVGCWLGDGIILLSCLYVVGIVLVWLCC